MSHYKAQAQASRRAKQAKYADGGTVREKDPRPGKGDRIEPEKFSSRYGGVDLPTAPKGTNERSFYDVRDRK